MVFLILLLCSILLHKSTHPQTTPQNGIFNKVYNLTNSTSFTRISNITVVRPKVSPNVIPTRPKVAVHRFTNILTVSLFFLIAFYFAETEI